MVVSRVADMYSDAICLVTGMTNFLKWFQCAAPRVLLLGLLLSWDTSVTAQVWDCGGQYTNLPEGKSACQPAGGVKSCGSDGNRYFSPRRSDERPSGGSCAPGPTGRSPFVDMRQKQLSQFGASTLHERMVAPSSVAAAPKRRVAQPVPLRTVSEKQGSVTVEDLYSCFANPDKLDICSPKVLGRFVEQTFMNASRAIERN